MRKRSEKLVQKEILQESIEPVFVRQLTISADEANRSSAIYSASGLIVTGGKIYTVSDDQLTLSVFDPGSNLPGSRIFLLPGSLPDNYDDRKKVKPDLEAIALLPPDQYSLSGAMFVVPSLSRPERVTGVLIPLNEDGTPSDNRLPLDFSCIREVLAGCNNSNSTNSIPAIKGLNIEGVAILQDKIKFFHRGSKKNGLSATMEVDKHTFLRALYDTHIVPQSLAESMLGTIKLHDLGKIEGVRLEFTDALALPDDEILFLCSAENTNDEYNDGVNLGTAIGFMDKSGAVKSLYRIAGQEKFEGVALVPPHMLDFGDRGLIYDNAAILHLFLVNDTDDAAISSKLYRLTLSTR